jgi:hypothetical protein
MKIKEKNYLKKTQKLYLRAPFKDSKQQFYIVFIKTFFLALQALQFTIMLRLRYETAFTAYEIIF